MKYVQIVSLFAALIAVLIASQQSTAPLLANPLNPVRAQDHSAGVAAHLAAEPQSLPLKFTSAKLSNNYLLNNYGMAVGDFNGDGHPDLAVTGFANSTSLIAVMLGNGDGTFSAPTNYSPGGSAAAYSVAIADVNGDGFLDLIVANLYAADGGDGSVGVLLGKGDGTFQPAVTYDSGGSRAEWVAIADVNGDKHPDIIVTNGCASTCQSYGTGLVSVLLNDGTGSFLPATNYSDGVSASGGPESVAVGDFNGDGHPDIVVSNQCVDNACSTGSLGVLLNNGNGTFQPAVQYSSGGYFYGLAVAAADMNGDGNQDLIVGNWCFNSACQTGAVSVLLGKGDGSFQPPVTFASGTIPAGSLAVGDINGDGHPDVLVVGGHPYGFYDVDVMLGNGDGSLQAAVPYETTTTVWVAIADLNGDGRPDLLSAADGGGVYGWLNALHEPCTTTVTSSVNPVIINQPVTLTATITSISPIPDGTVISFQTQTELGTGLTKNGVASLTTSFAQAKFYSISATFSGDPFHGKSTGYVKGGETVTLYPSTTTVVSSPNPSDYGQPVTLTATVSSRAPGGATGKVNFMNGTTFLGTAILNRGTAVMITSKLPVGTLTITANYKGDSQTAASSGTTTQTVN